MTLEFDIGGMTCLDCSTHVQRALERVAGVASASVDYRAGRGMVTLESGAPRSHEIEYAIVGAVQRAGYTASLLNGEGRSHPVALTPPFADASAIDAVTPSPADYDLMIIGTGGAGVAAAIQAVGMGGKVAIVESGVLGGTCVNVGCIPSKTLIEAAAHYHRARRGFPGISPCQPVLDWPAVVAAKDDLVRELRQTKYADILASFPGLKRLEGRATLLPSSAGLVRVRVADAEHVARKVLLAVGTVPAMPLLPGLDQVDALDSTTAMSIAALPGSLLVLGGGPVGVELGQMFARLGVQVTIVQRGPHLLPDEDHAISAVLRASLEGEGIEVHTTTEAVRVERDGDGVVVHVRQGRLDGQLRAERLLVATGRQPNTRDLGLEDAGVERSPRGFVRVDATMQTSNVNIYAAGDVTGGPGYVYVAAAGARIAAENAVKSIGAAGTSSDDAREFDLAVVPSVTFTDPQVASVGISEAAARAAGLHVDVSALDMAHVPRALVARDARGLVKIVAESGSGRILGVHAVAPNAGEFMGEAALAVRFGLTARDLSGTLHPYLTWGESMKLAAQGFSMDISKLSCCA